MIFLCRLKGIFMRFAISDQYCSNLTSPIYHCFWGTTLIYFLPHCAV